jgi:hypothetical protein
MKLWRATVELTVYLLAEDAPEARHVAPGAAAEEMGDGYYPDAVDVREVESVEDIDPDWREAIPRNNGRSFLTCAEFIAARLDSQAPSDAPAPGGPP